MKKYREQKKYYPTLISNENGIKKPGEGYKRLQKLQALPQKTQDILVSDKIVDFIYGVEQRYHLQDVQTEEFSRTVRGYFFREVTEGGFAQKISALCKISPDEALKLLRAINAIQPKKETKNDKNYIKLSFNNAIKKYPSILKQVITDKNIITKPFLKALKPTVKNWIVVYEKILDVSKHNTIERGEFVFRSDATKGLNEDERKKLLELFKSRDENDKLTIDVDSGKIVFEIVQNTSKQDVNLPKKQIKPTDIQQNNNIQNKQKEVVVTQNLPQKEHIQRGGGNDISKNRSSGDNKNFVTQNSNPINDISHNLNKNINPQFHKSKNNENQNINTQKIVKKENVSKQVVKDYTQVSKKLPKDIQKEIIKNKKEMGKSDENTQIKKEEKKIGTIVFDTSVDDKKMKEDDLQLGSVNNKIKKQKRVQSGVGNPVQKNDINKIQPAEEVHPKIVIDKTEKEKRIKGKISFSSNHVMPAEKTKKILKKQQTQQQNSYNAFNMKPIGQIHSLDKKDDAVDIENTINIAQESKK